MHGCTCPRRRRPSPHPRGARGAAAFTRLRACRDRGGAAGYLLKTESPERIAEFLEGVVHGDAALSGPVARRLLDQVRSGGRGSGVPDRIASVLSARELEVLLLLDEHHGTEEIAQRLFISEHTVRSHVKSLLRKLGVSSRREALEQLALARSRLSLRSAPV